MNGLLGKNANIQTLIKPTASYITWSIHTSKSQGINLDWGEWGVLLPSTAERKWRYTKDSRAYRVTISSLTMEVEAVTHRAEAGLPEWHKDHLCHHAQTQWTCCKNGIRDRLPGKDVPMHSLGWKDCWGSTALTIPEIQGMKRQKTGKDSRHHNLSTAWQGRSTERLKELSEHGQTRTLQHWLPAGKMKCPTFLGPTTICVQPYQYRYCFKGNTGGTALKKGKAHMGLSEHYNTILKENWNWNFHKVDSCVHKCLHATNPRICIKCNKAQPHPSRVSSRLSS